MPLWAPTPDERHGLAADAIKLRGLNRRLVASHMLRHTLAFVMNRTNAGFVALYF